MKKFLLTLCLLMGYATLHADTETVNGITWTYQVSNGKAEIYGRYDYNSYTYIPAIPATTGGAITIPSILGGYPVTSIGDLVFYRCSGLTAVTIPEGVTSIGDYAFYSCDSLTSVTIPEGVTSIGDYAFYGCSSLTSVTIPSSVTEIGWGAFYDCSKLWKDTNGVQYESEAKVVLIDVPTSATGEFVIPNTVRFIHSNAFYDCSSLTSVTIPEGVTSIGDQAFYYCSRLTSVTIPPSVTSIGWNAFEGVAPITLTASWIPHGMSTDNLKTLIIPEGVTSIGHGAFHDCSGLTSVTIPSSVTTIGDQAFYRCSNLTLFDFKGEPPSVGYYAFYNISSSATGTYLPQYASEWEAVINAIGKWNGLAMKQHIAPDVTLVFNANGGIGGKTITQVAGTTLTAPTVTRTGYTFTGWSPAVPATVPAQNVTYTAQWKANQYTLTFNANGGTGGKTLTQNYGTKVTAPTVTRTGYTFTGWSPTVPTTAPAKNVTYTAQWQINQYTLAFNANGGTGGKTLKQNYGTKVTAPTVTREGYTFTGWSPEVPTTVPANNTTYTAQWEVSPRYDVVVNVLGAGSVSGTGSYWGGATVSLVATANEGYLFCGWSTTPVVMETTYAFIMPEEAVTLTAYFAPKAAVESYVNGSALMSKDEAVQEALDANEVFTADEMKEMAFGAPVVEVKEDVIEIAISLQTAESLDAWQAMALQGATLEIDSEKGQVRVKVPKGDKKAAFYKFIVPTEQ